MPTVEQVIDYLRLFDPKTEAVLTEGDVTSSCEFVAMDAAFAQMEDADDISTERVPCPGCGVPAELPQRPDGLPEDEQLCNGCHKSDL